MPQVTRTRTRSGAGDLLNQEDGCPSCTRFLSTRRRPQEGSVPDDKSRNSRGRLSEALGNWGSEKLEGRGGLGEGWGKWG